MKTLSRCGRAAAKLSEKDVPQMAAENTANFEAAMTRLEQIVCLLERGDAPLEQAMTLFEEGAKILRECTAQLDQAEQKVALLTAGEEGQPQEHPFQGEV